jgi:hypothetical protein
MKTELIERLKGLLANEDVVSIKNDVKSVINDFNAETAKERRLQQEAWDSEEHEEGAMFDFLTGENDGIFELLVQQYKDRVQEHGKKIAEEQKANLTTKLDILEEFEKLTREEEDIKAAFDRFNAISEKWKAVGDIPGDRYKEVQDRFLSLKDTFFYKVNIYKELRELDLKKNTQAKEDLITRAKELLALESIKDMEMSIRALQKEWSDIGPSTRETYKELGDTFFGIVREVVERIKGHYDSIKQEQEGNLSRKRELVEKMKPILSLDLKNHASWNKKTDEVLALQKEWKEIGFAPKKENEEVWQEFRTLCDLFFERKGKYYESRRSEQDQSKKNKEELIAKAREIQHSTDWKKTTEELVFLQKKWKDCGAATPRDEQKLWQQFRAACDVFFQNKKKHFEGMGERQEENLALKESILSQIEAYQLSGEKNKDISTLKELSTSFMAIGHVPKEKIKDLFDRYHKALDAKYGGIQMDQDERKMMAFKERISEAKDSGDGERFIKRERQFLREKIDHLRTTVLQYQNNMERFTGAGAEALKKEIEKKIRQSEKEIEEARKKLSLLRDQPSEK